MTSFGTQGVHVCSLVNSQVYIDPTSPKVYTHYSEYKLKKKIQSSRWKQVKSGFTPYMWLNNWIAIVNHIVGCLQFQESTAEEKWNIISFHTLNCTPEASAINGWWLEWRRWISERGKRAPQRLRAGSPHPAVKWKLMMFWSHVILYEVSWWQYFCKELKCRWIAIFYRFAIELLQSSHKQLST